MGWTGHGGVLKTGLQVRRSGEEERQWARNNRDNGRIHVDIPVLTGEFCNE